MDTKRETRWVLLAQSGDRRALDELFRSVQHPLYRCLLGIIGDPGLAEDALQEVFVQIYRKLGALREPSVFRSWAFRIASRHAFRAVKKERHWKEQIRDDDLLQAAQAPPPIEPPANLLARLPTLVGKVSPASRAVLVLHYMEELELREISVVLGLSLGTVKSRLSYGLASLRKQMNKKSEATHGR